MKCSKCNFNNIKYPFACCPICGATVKWTKKDIIKNIMERILLPAGMAFITTVIMRLLLE